MVIHPQARTTPKLRAEIKAQRDRKVSAKQSALLLPLEVGVPG